jgi:antitoxin YefM
LHPGPAALAAALSTVGAAQIDGLAPRFEGATLISVPQLSEIAEEVDRTHRRVQITKNGRSYVVLISAEDLASLEATVELLSDAEAMQRGRQAQTDLEDGNLTTGEEMAELVRQRRDTPAGG